MASTFVNDLRLEEMATGENSGTWGTKTNTNLELIGEALGFGTEAITTNADTHTSTIADGSTDPVRAMFVKYTGTLDSACTITIAPNTLSRVHIIENATSGSQNIIIKQGSGATVTIPNGMASIVYLDGAGSGAAVVDALTDLNIAGTFNAASDIVSAGTIQATGDTAAGDGAAMGFTSTEGLILTGQGSTNDVSVKNDADTTVIAIPTGTDDVEFTDDVKLKSDSAVLSFGADGDVTLTHAADTSLTCNVLMAATTFEPSGDTAAGDNAAIGFTSAEGLILTGQGSTNDVTVKNDADADVIKVPTGTTNVEVVGNLTVGGTLSGVTTGKVLQVVQAIEQRSSNASSSATSYTNVTGLTCSITPSASSSKILVQASFYVHTQSQNYSDITLFRDSTNLATMTEARFLNQRGDGDTDNSNNGFGFFGMVTLQILDSPSSTSELDYTFQSKRGDPQNNSIFFLSGGVNSIICTEIAG